MFINTEYYRIFYYVAQCGNITSAAKILFNSQPNLTRAIKNLESELGCSLFYRTNRGMKLTPEGEKLYHHLSIAFEQIDLGEKEIQSSLNLTSGIVSIAVTEIALRDFLLSVLKEYRALYPEIRFSLGNYLTLEALDELRNNTADLAVFTQPYGSFPLTEEYQDLEFIKIKTIHEVAICSTQRQELLNHSVNLEELSHYPLISLISGTLSYQTYTKLFSSYNLTFKPDIETATADLILPMVEADLGIGFVPEALITDNKKVKAISLSVPLPLREVYLAKRLKQPLNVAAQRLESLIIAH